MTTRKAFAMTMVFLGGYFLIAGDGMMAGSIIGICLALIAGLGYASFIFAWKFFKLRSTLETFWWFLAYGFAMLAVPYAWSGAPIPSVNTIPALLALGIIPSFCGFYCTILALQHIEAYKTQVIESSEPFFSALFAAVFFGEWLTGPGMLAALAIIVGALITSVPERGAISIQVRPIGEGSRAPLPLFPRTNMPMDRRRLLHGQIGQDRGRHGGGTEQRVGTGVDACRSKSWWVAMVGGPAVNEASWHVTPRTAPAIAAIGVDFTSVGWIMQRVQISRYRAGHTRLLGGG
ncbi:hypothetical protein AJ88_21995 [Mesorhizobium amorphae CCBAU 01583]|nr:hypothetical protein AJ88_21995 [Mesorhizobium amorphae CCBAU 01583]